MKRLCLTLIVFASSNFIFGSVGAVSSGFGTITDAVSDNEKLYFFEVDNSINMPTWIHDTMIRVYDNDGIRNLSEKLFIRPTELKEYNNSLYFAVLSDSCIGQVTCDYQDVLKMSKIDGSVSILIRDLKSAVHISFGNDTVYISESNGKIWKINHDGSSKRLITQTENIIMDLASSGNDIYWIEEISDQNNSIIVLQDGLQPKIVDNNLKIPYDLNIEDQNLYWNEIYVKPTSDAFADFTMIKVNKDDNTYMLMEFKNTSPISILQLEPHYKSYLVSGGFVYFSNNTANNSVIQRMDLDSNEVQDVASVNYDVKYLRADKNSLYAVGYDNNNDEFVLEKFSLSAIIPEFPFALLVLTSAFMSVILSKKFFLNKIRL